MLSEKSMFDKNSDYNKDFVDNSYIPFEYNFDFTKNFIIDRTVEDSINFHFESYDIKSNLNLFIDFYEFNIETIPSYDIKLFDLEYDDFMRYNLDDWECFDDPYIISDVFYSDNIQLMKVTLTIEANIEEYLVESWDAGYDPNILKLMTDFQLGPDHILVLLDQLMSLQNKQNLNIIEDITGEFRVVKYDNINIEIDDIFYIYLIIFLRFFSEDFTQEIEFKLIDFSKKN